MMTSAKTVPDQRADVSRLLKEQREKANLTQAELAARLGAQQSFVSKYEASERRLDIVEIYAICLAIGTSFPELADQLDRQWTTKA